MRMVRSDREAFGPEAAGSGALWEVDGDSNLVSHWALGLTSE